MLVERVTRKAHRKVKVHVWACIRIVFLFHPDVSVAPVLKASIFPRGSKGPLRIVFQRKT